MKKNITGLILAAAVMAPHWAPAAPLADELIGVDNVSARAFQFVGHGSIPHTVSGNSTNHLLLVSISVNNTAEARGTVTNVLYGTLPLTMAGTRINDDKVVSMWTMTNPPAGTTNVLVRFNRPPGEGWSAGVMTLRNVDLASPGMFSSDIGNSGNPVIAGLPSESGGLVVDTVAMQSTNLTATGIEQTQRWSLSSAPIPPGFATCGGSTKPGAASVDMSWTANGNSGNWAIGALALQPYKTPLQGEVLLEITSISMQNNQVVVEWPGTSKGHYTVMTTTSLRPPVPWSDLVGYVAVAGVDGIMSATDTNGLPESRFYRIKMQQY